MHDALPLACPLQSDMRLMCPDGGCATVDKFSSCNLAKVPAGALVGPPELQGSQLGNDIKAAIVNAGGLLL